MYLYINPQPIKNMSNKKTFDRFNHCVSRMRQRYEMSNANIEDVKAISRKIRKNNFKPTPFSVLRKEERHRNVVYGIVEHKGITFSCAFDKFEDQMKTFLNPPSGSFSTIGNEMTNILDKLNLN